MSLILLVEDNELNRDMLCRRLARRDYKVITAVDGLEALECARTDKPDLILMDMSLPNMNGWEASHQLKEDTETRSIPIIALTAHAMGGDRDRALAAGCDDYATKPVELQVLLQKMESLIKGRRQGD